MSTAKNTFKTTINCGGCVKAVTPFLDAAAGAGNWEVETDHPEKLLHVNTEAASVEAVREAVEKAGFKIEDR